jgi:Zn-dependent oligopeptidase
LPCTDFYTLKILKQEHDDFEKLGEKVPKEVADNEEQLKKKASSIRENYEKQLFDVGLKDDLCIIRKDNKQLYIKQKDCIISITIEYCPKCGKKIGVD